MCVCHRYKESFLYIDGVCMCVSVYDHTVSA